MTIETELQYKSVYCPVCSCCGEEGCCNPMLCRQSPKGDYCEKYLQDLKFGYLMYDQIQKLIPEDEQTQKEFDRIFDESFERIYGDKNQKTNT